MNLNKLIKIYTRRSSEAGYTILEGIMAVIVVSALLTFIGPVVAFSVGTRVQAKRVELAAQAASSYVNGVKSGAISVEDIEAVNFERVGGNRKTDFVDAVDAPGTGTFDCNTTGYCNAGGEQLYCIDLDENEGCDSDSLSDMMVQAFRSSTNGSDADDGYLLGVRVYRANSFKLAGDLKIELPSTNLTNALGDVSAPLVNLTTEVAPEGVAPGDMFNIYRREQLQ
jgi:type II secretory pathway pseudopilin PulG